MALPLQIVSPATLRFASVFLSVAKFYQGGFVGYIKRKLEAAGRKSVAIASTLAW